MYYRKDVSRIAEKLSAAAQMDFDHVYWFLIETWKALHIHPRKLEFSAAPGRIILVSDPDNFRLENFEPAKPWIADYDGPDYEAMIFDRFDRYNMDLI